MVKRVQFIRHIKSAADLFLGLVGELTVNTTDKVLRVHDGATIGGHEMARKDVANVPAATGSNDGKMTSTQVGDLSTVKSDVAAHIDAASGHPDVTTSDPGFASAADKTKLDAIETAATADQNAADIRGLGFFDVSNDGSGSGLDADLLDGNQGSTYATVAALASQLTTLRGELNAPSTTKALFPQAAAPTGWVKDTDQNNKALRIVSGGTGGDAAGATAFSSVFGSGKTAGNTSLTEAQLPVVTLTGIKPVSSSNRGNTADDGSKPVSVGSPDATFGSGNSHSHTLSLDLQYVDIIKATKS